MTDSTKKLLSVTLALLSLNGCATSHFKVTKRARDKVEFSISPDRILLHCIDMDTDTEEKMFMFMIHTLNEDNQVIDFIQGNFFDEKYCNYRNQKMEKILRNGKSIYLAAFGDLEPSPRLVSDPFSYAFPRHGTFQTNGTQLSFVALINEKGECFGAHTSEDEPCLDEAFPIQDHEIIK
jgi:hypothetical protein